MVTVAGELDLLTTPRLQACLTDQLATAPPHLIVDLQPVRFLSAAGLSCLNHARELARTQGRPLHPRCWLRHGERDDGRRSRRGGCSPRTSAPSKTPRSLLT